MKYKEKEVAVVDAEIFDPNLYMDPNNPINKTDLYRAIQHDPSNTKAPFFVETLSGKVEMKPGYFIIKGVIGEFYPCNPKVFEILYERAELVIFGKGGGRTAIITAITNYHKLDGCIEFGCKTGRENSK